MRCGIYIVLLLTSSLSLEFSVYNLVTSDPGFKAQGRSPCLCVLSLAHDKLLRFTSDYNIVRPLGREQGSQNPFLKYIFKQSEEDFTGIRFQALYLTL